MADVSVEFGAKDTGLEQTLKTVQAELSKLESEVKSGELSFDQLQQAMRKIAQAEKVEAQLQAMASGMDAAGNSASGAEPKLDAAGNEAKELGDKVEGAGQQANSGAGLFDAGFAKIAAAFAVGNIAAKAFEKIVDGVFSAAKAVVDGFGGALDMGARLTALSQRTGESAGSLLVLETAFKNAHISADQVGTSINKLQNFMAAAGQEGSNQAATMSRLGISLSDLEGKTPTQQMGVFAKAIAAIQDPTQKVAAASEIFGQKLGGKLLPVLNDFPGALDDARSKVGSLEDVMNENAATFDAFGNSIDAVKGKFAAFAAGIMGETLPAVAEFATELEKVDAAGLGKQIGQELNPRLQEMADILRGTIDLVKGLGSAEQSLAQDNGALGSTYRAVNESLMGFNQMMHDAFTRFTPFGYAMQTLKNRGEELRESQDAATDAIQETASATEGATDSMSSMAESVGDVQTSLDGLIDGGGEAFDSINRGAIQFKSLIDEGNISLSDMSGEISAQIPLTNEHVALMGDLNVSLGEANEKASEQLNKIEEQISAEQRRNEKIAERQAKSAADYALQLQINEALAAGNTEEAKRLENQREFSRLTERIMRDTGMTKEDAEQLADNLLSTKSAADAASESARNLANNTRGAKGEAESARNEFQSVRETMADIENAKLEASPQRLKERTIDARKELKDMADFIGEDLSKMSLDDILKKLGLDPNSFKTTDEKLKALEGAIQKIGEADPAQITPEVDLVGVNDRLEKVKGYLAGTEKEKPDVTPEIDQSAVRASVDKAKKTITDGLTGQPVDVTLNAEESIGKIREQLKDEIDVAIQSSKGTEHLSSIDKLVGKIEELVSKIEGKLPMQALA
jgi:TP901 family phage tail tape measure protein